MIWPLELLNKSYCPRAGSAAFIIVRRRHKGVYSKILDLTRGVSPSTKVFPGSPQPSFIAWSTFAAHGYDSEVVHMSTHTGTHMDAPSHFAPGAPAIDRIAPARL
ncbi:MAG: hypothetical protein C4292_05815, partial [Nitrososphaera sp.]